MKKKLIVFFAFVLISTLFSSCSINARWEDKKTLADGERIAELPFHGRNTLTYFDEVLDSSDIVATVRVLEFRGYYPYHSVAGRSAFELEIVELHRNNIEYTGSSLILLQLGIPEKTAIGYPLLKNGDVLLLALQSAGDDIPGAKDYSQSFCIVNNIAICQLYEVDGLTYAINRSSPSYFVNCNFSENPEEISDKVISKLQEADPVLKDAHIFNTYNYQDILDYMEDKK